MLQLRPELFRELSTPAGLEAGLQHAIELEHATVPVYLYALYSLKPGQNSAIGRLIKSVVMEEMGHFALACNLLNAIGGRPKIQDPSFVPSFPGPLPGTVRGGLSVSMERFSRQHVLDVFMEIEEPVKPLNFPTLLEVAPSPTIGQFYRSIRDQIVAGGSSLFTGDPARQLSADAELPGVVAVTDVGSAVKAIDDIVEQGEGTEEDPHDTEQDLAHYYKFAEIYHGHRLIRDPAVPDTAPPDQRYAYRGEPIPFDPQGVFPLRANPKAAAFPEEARLAATDFNRAYTKMLGHLQRAVTGDPAALGQAIGVMRLELKPMALQLVRMPVSDTENAGPTFEYVA